MNRNYIIEKNEGSITTLTDDYGFIYFKEDGKIFAHKLTKIEYNMSNEKLFEMADKGIITIPEYEEKS